jgi:SAM-dependent methyltransferase
MRMKNLTTELIEHLPNPLQFLELCKKQLKDDGTILLTTPNYNKNKIWNTDLPPIHIFWFSKKSFAALAKSCDLDLSFINFNRFVSKNDLLAFLPRISLPGSTLDTELKAVQTEAIFNSTLRQIVTRFAYCTPIRYASHYIYRLISAEYPLLGVILTKK